MTAKLSRQVVEEVRARTDIVQVISQYVNLKRTGKNYLGLCPFHSEKTPSFTVSPDKGIFYCFGCQAGGTVFDFLMRRESLPFPEVLRMLAERAGLTLPEQPRTPEERRRAQDRERAAQALELAAAFYHDMLLKAPEGDRARKYLAARGIGSAAVQTFRLGYAPPGWSGLLDSLRRRGLEPADLEQAGLVGKRDSGEGHYDRFRDRLMFPIASPWGRVVGFGARALGAEHPKYLNSPETALFSKGRLLYGLPQAREGIRARGRALLVEGYTDVIACHQAGLDHAVASLGTAFTREQARLLLQLAPEVVIAYDADAAGTTATLRGLNLLREVGCNVRVAVLPAGQDPDDCLRERGKEELEHVLDAALPLPEYHFHLACRDADLSAVQGKVAVARSLLPVLASLDNEVEREAYLERFARAIGVSTRALARDLEEYRRKHAPPADSSAARWDNSSAGRVRQRVGTARRAAEELLRAMAADPELARHAAARGCLDLFEDPMHREIAQGLLEVAAGGGATVGEFVETLENGKTRSLAASLLQDDRPPEVLARVAEDCLRTLHRLHRRRRVGELQREIKEREARGEGIDQSLLEELQDLLRELQGFTTANGFEE